MSKQKNNISVKDLTDEELELNGRFSKLNELENHYYASGFKTFAICGGLLMATLGYVAYNVKSKDEPTQPVAKQELVVSSSEQVQDSNGMQKQAKESASNVLNYSLYGVGGFCALCAVLAAYGYGRRNKWKDVSTSVMNEINSRSAGR